MAAAATDWEHEWEWAAAAAATGEGELATGGDPPSPSLYLMTAFSRRGICRWGERGQGNGAAAGA